MQSRHACPHDSLRKLYTRFGSRQGKLRGMQGSEAPEGWYRTAEELCHTEGGSPCWQAAISPSLEASLACLCDCKPTPEGAFYRISPSRV